MGYWENTTYLKHERIEDVVQTLDTLLLREGMTRIAAPPQRSRLSVEPMQYDKALDNDLWGIALFPGAESWCVIKTAPLELLAERAEGSDQMRLAHLCNMLCTSAFQINVYDGSIGVLVEVSSEGNVLMSGINAQSADPMCWHGIEINEKTYRDPAFELHPFNHLLQTGPLGDDFAKATAHEFGGRNAEYCDNIVSVDTLISHKPLDAHDGVALYYKWSGVSRQRRLASDTYEQYRR